MPCIKSLLLTSLRYAGLLSLPAAHNPHPLPLQPTANAANLPAHEAADFNQLLDSVPAASLHAALHAHLPPSRFKDGMFERDASAVRALHSSDAALATHLVAAARYDLLRRQNGNLTSTTTTGGNQPPPVIVPVTLTSTDAAGATVVQTSLALSAATASVAVVVTASTDAAGQPALLTTFVPGIVLTDAAGQVTTTRASTPSTITTTNAQGQTVVATVTPGGGVVDAIVLVTTTLPNGQLSTYTSYVNPTSTNGPQLQNAAPPQKRFVSVSGVLLLAVAFGALLL